MDKKIQIKTPEQLKAEALKPPKPTSSVKNPMSMGSLSLTVKTPKAKKMADPFGKPSLFFKSEEFGSIKKTSIENLRAFLEKQRQKRNLK